REAWTIHAFISLQQNARVRQRPSRRFALRQQFLEVRPLPRRQRHTVQLLHRAALYRKSLPIPQSHLDSLVVWLSGTVAAERHLVSIDEPCPDHEQCRRLAFALWLRGHRPP